MFGLVVNIPLLPVRIKKQIILYEKLKTVWPLFISAVQLSQGYRGTTRRQFTFYHSLPRIYWYSFDQHQKDERPS